MQLRANHVWMAGVGSAADEAEVLRCCREGAIPPPEHLLKVGSCIVHAAAVLIFCCEIKGLETGAHPAA